ncbi:MULTISPECIES: 50S ribosomal protein L31 [Alcanivorax]|jgi:large subunit ribosomal protein L31|uniref:50S ribosomal protein L31 n=1 Tax=Alcanivorax TaxID=59753 RepID=UPI000789D8BB|nr:MULTISPECIES: 50S ribosomal protein L31 [Alcanivorax]KZX75504.1 50S ribosomal protein L31 [Alcanivorax sp. HI0011]KZX77832.1 50S ribosomal protein L31 [Alcanivorax sp. HI0013]KZY16284.1 50S ribosomal protein L31 [Alcanivorax sp. HI0035]MEE2603169.1 50S ribosomal protein L31 [Pseudomonadota bacterium]KZX65415.1 50S ribosomal protein L31 [Alcanivorax sp. HI0003]|tara:strand:- start:216 stop:434 length:219 start_codon:yes stop_codon:yes gene_type:complete
MKPEIHPEYQAATYTCSCGNVIESRSTRGGDMALDVCSSCHPFYTGKQKQADSGGQIDKFKQRFGMMRSKKD